MSFFGDDNNGGNFPPFDGLFNQDLFNQEVDKLKRSTFTQRDQGHESFTGTGLTNDGNMGEPLEYSQGPPMDQIPLVDGPLRLNSPGSQPHPKHQRVSSPTRQALENMPAHFFPQRPEINPAPIANSCSSSTSSCSSSMPIYPPVVVKNPSTTSSSSVVEGNSTSTGDFKLTPKEENIIKSAVEAMVDMFSDCLSDYNPLKEHVLNEMRILLAKWLTFLKEHKGTAGSWEISKNFFSDPNNIPESFFEPFHAKKRPSGTHNCPVTFSMSVADGETSVSIHKEFTFHTPIEYIRTYVLGLALSVVMGYTNDGKVFQYKVPQYVGPGNVKAESLKDIFLASAKNIWALMFNTFKYFPSVCHICREYMHKNPMFNLRDGHKIIAKHFHVRHLNDLGL